MSGIKLDEDKKFKVLLAELQERYNASHQIRYRGFQTVIAITGASVALSWLLLSKITFEPNQKVLLSILIIVLLSGVLYFINSLRKGSQNNRKVMINIESALRLFDEGYYIPNDSLLLKEYSGKNHKKNDVFPIIIIWIIVIGIILLVLVWLPINSRANNNFYENFKFNFNLKEK